MNKAFLPISKEDLNRRGWAECDIILITGDAYVDHPSYGTAVIGRVLEDAGFRVGIIAQPDWKTSRDFQRLGKPRLFFGVTAGNLDSHLSYYTANKKPRRSDDYSPGGKTGLRPLRATIVYANKIKELFPGVPVVLGGIEASLTRLAHYSFWDDAVRRSVLVDAKADMLVYGMGEKAVVEIAERLRNGEDIRYLDHIRGTAVVRSDAQGFNHAVTIPSFEAVQADHDKFNEAFKMTYEESDPIRGKTILQQHGDRFVVQFPPALPFESRELDRIYELPYARTWHPVYDKQGGVPGFATVRFSIISHRGCAGECNFCSLFAHQGRIVQSRSRESILREVRLLAGSKDFKGTITDIGGPTANLYEAGCEIWEKAGACRNKHCLMPEKCRNLKLGYAQTIELWKEVLKIPGVKHLFISSGLRYDLLTEPYADEYLGALSARHISGQLKVAPEHKADAVLKLMNKSCFATYEKFAGKFKQINRQLGKNQYLVNYFISSHPGTTLKDSLELALYLVERRMQPEQIQDFIPLPMTVSACMYHTGKHPFTGEKVPVAKSFKERQLQRALLQYGQPKNRKLVSEALDILKRGDLKKIFLSRTRGIKSGPASNSGKGNSENSRRSSYPSKNKGFL
ncbi:MAG: YgiQ family radical SAM protein [Candidatus Omnitrophica bacterium]|nr:YgiQ family radical SAM protein [Candidatus Omnitrophota bacterium]MDD5671541.1 YgiQ family radical SAM protein [Candidatus Omnitrophota bacterium]